MPDNTETIAVKPHFNKQPLLDVVAHIMEEPARLMMHDWIYRGEPGTMVWGWENSNHEEHRVPACGTVACVAAWITTLNGRDNEGCPRSIALDILGIPAANARNDDWIMYTSVWPIQYEERWSKATLMLERAYILSDVVDIYIAEMEEKYNAQ